MHWLLCENTASARLLRTILQALLAFVVTYLPQIVGMWDMSEWMALALVGFVMCVLSPVMEKLGHLTTPKKISLNEEIYVQEER